MNYVKNCVKTNKIIIFELSNSIYHGIFKDKSEVLVDLENKKLIYIDEFCTKYSFCEGNSEEGTKEIKKIEDFNQIISDWIQRDSEMNYKNKSNFI